MTPKVSLRSSTAFRIVTGLFIFFLLWRFYLYFMPAVADGEFNPWSFAWGATYQVIALFGAILGFWISTFWGGWKSRLGRLTLILAFGLLFQSIGQGISSWYVYITGDIPYPSWGDVGFFGSVLFYIWASFVLARLSGAVTSLKTFASKLVFILVPIAAIVISYLVFLLGQDLDWSAPLTVFLDIGYPLGQALYVSIAILTFYMSRNVLGGVMRGPIFLFLIALIAQYISDFTFLYQAAHNLYIPEGLNDLMYFVSYYLMAVALIDLGQAFKTIRES